MAEFWGLNAISARMGVHPKTLLRWHRERRFFMYERRRRLSMERKARRSWYTNDELIARWELAQCHADWRSRYAKPQDASPRRRVDSAPSTSAEVGA